MIGNIQLLRVIAASGVVLYHGKFILWGVHIDFFGVAIFFVLSGYLMCMVSNRSPLTFALDRLWRIVPNYWLATALLLTVCGMWKYWPLEHMVLSAFFIPHESIAGNLPVLGVGWTLNLEMYFYAIFTLAIFINRAFAPIIVASIIITVKLLLQQFAENGPILLYAAEYVIFFVYGIAIWYITQWVKNRSPQDCVPRWTFPFILAIYMVATIFFYANPFITVPSLFFASILAANHGADRNTKLLILMGDASYACYLLHTILIEILRRHGVDIDGSMPVVIGTLVGSWVIAVVWYISVEKLVLQLRKVIEKSGREKKVVCTLPLDGLVR